MFDWLYFLLQKVEGRDKLSKLFIYLLKLIDASLTYYRQYPTYKMQKIAIHFQRARQFMRLGKFIIEYQQALALINQENKDEFGRLIKIILHAIFSVYWALDNLSLLAVFGLVNMAEYQFTQSAMTIKLVGMTIANFYNLRTWLRLHHQELNIRMQLRKLEGVAHLEKERELMGLVLKQWKMFLLCIKFGGEMLPTLGRSQWGTRLLGVRISRMLQALGGLVNALASCVLVNTDSPTNQL